MVLQRYADLYAEVESDIAKMESELAELKAVRRYLETKDGRKPELPSTGTVANDPPAPRRFSRMKQIESAVIVLKEATGPLKTREIARRLIEGGVHADIARLKTSLFTTMTRKPELFSKAGAGLWMLKESEK